MDKENGLFPWRKVFKKEKNELSFATPVYYLMKPQFKSQRPTSQNCLANFPLKITLDEKEALVSK